ncbi:amidohydrolase family protein [Candidatus Sulfidibacterium hydrothermale]|uniref:amidohydrolase family protein n=1 Tax=Candidatus Sulfidibacterium hydrothermale TaxID=2875962 RepID=UPI001F0B154A|nr:amidohydrolase family protein [Candidatus Sulfidibacterium hydrothermale]UBM62238.1 amidohydrolase family protein [Candidatus Sulfidibacterium hydrothermale]
MSILLKNARFLDWKTLRFKETNLLVEPGLDGKITFLETTHPVSEDTEVLDCKGMIVTKSFVVGHHHVYSALARGMGAPKKNPENFVEILQYIWWTLDKALDRDMIEASALSTAIACAKAGSTFAIDHHASPNAVRDSLEIIAKAFDQVGVSHLLCYEISDRDGKDIAEEGLEETESYLQNHQGLVGLHASFTVGNETLKKAAILSEKYNSGFHIHVAEDVFDEEFTRKEFGKSVVERLKDTGALDSSKTILGHCLHLSHAEKEWVQQSKAWVVQNPDSNLNNHVGFFNGENLGDRIMLGTDGMHSDMIRSAQQAYFVGQTFDDIDFSKAYQRFRNVHHYLNENHFTGDGENNLVILDYKSPTPVSEENFLGHFIFGLQASDVRHVISNGQLIVKDRKIQTINEEDVLTFTKKQALRLWERMQQ